MNIEPVINKVLRQAALTPENIALKYDTASYTYRELAALASHVAQSIIQAGLSTEDVVGILIPRNQWLAIAPVGVLAAGCAYMPLDPAYPAERLNYMLLDSHAKLLIADREVLSGSGLTTDGGYVLIEDGRIPILYIDKLNQRDRSLHSGQSPDHGPVPLIQPETLALLIYTSGSTGQPKGCMIEQRNISCLVEEAEETMVIDSTCRVANYASFSFIPTVQDIFATFSTGATLYILPDEIRFDFVRLAQFIDDNAITHIIMSTMTARQFVSMYDCKSLRCVSAGGEKLDSVTPLSQLRFLNVYGSSECCGMVTCHAVKGDEDNVPIGKAPGTYRLYIVGEDGQPVADGEAGELWVSGPQLCRGYLNHPELTANVFISNPFNDAHEDGYERVFRTGDFVRRGPDGSLLFAGRRDGLVKIRGFRVELREVEAVVQTCPGVTGATVQSASDPLNGTYIVAYVTGEGELDCETIKQHVAEQKPAYMVPEVVMQIPEIPRNFNGKVDRKRLPKPVRGASQLPTADIQQPENDLQRELHHIIASEIGTEDFGINTPLLLTGMTSVSAIKVCSLVHKKYGVSINAQNITKDFSLLDIEKEIKQDTHPQPLPEREGIESEASRTGLSYPQTGVYVDCINNPESTIYNIPMMAGLPLSIDTEALAKAVTTIIKSHPELSVHFENDGSDTMQVTDPDQNVDIPITTMSEEELTAYKYAFVRPFDIEAGPLYRVEIVKTQQRVCLLTDFHHLVADGGSYDLFYRQLCSTLEGNPIDAEDLSYADYVAAEKEAAKGDYSVAAKAFFDKRLDGVEGMTEIQPDLTDTVEQGYVSTVATPLDMEAINEFCRQQLFTPTHLTLSGVFYALSRFANNDRLCITTVSNGRSNLRIADTMGMFVNTLVLSSQIGSQRVIDFVHETCENFRETLRHENYPFAQIASDYGLSAEIMFAYQIGVINHYWYQGTELEMENLEQNNVPKFPIAIFIREADGRPSVCVEYDNGRYSEGMMQSLADSICQAITAFIREPEAALQSVSLLDEKQAAVLDSFNQTDVDYDDTQTIVSLFRRQAKETPDNIAVVYQDKRYTYAEIDEMSDRIAGYVVSLGLGAEDVVSILIPRCEWMPIASLGVLKAGCAYQPLDPTYPKERLNFMMQDAGAKLLIADEELRPIVDEYQGEVLLTKNLVSCAAVAQQHTEPRPESLFILLYTSGSTGVPKGCQLTHGNLVAFCHWYQRYYGLKPEHHVSAYASYGFDANMMETYPALTCGATVHIIPEEIRLDLVALNDYFEREHITNGFMTTQVAYQFATSIENHSLNYLSTGGEKLACITPPEGFHFINLYGPTETTVLVTCYDVDKKQKEIPIGKAIDNIHLYIVDAQGHRLPLGAAGELWVSGPQVSRGYLNRPEETEKAYIDNPFTEDKKYIRIYKTGDIVRYLPDGNIQFVGRRDGQVKIRGFRIELKEVEAVIREFSGIKDATVQAFDDDGGGKFIAAYIVSDSTVDIEALNHFILDQKPPYMVPAVTMQIDSIPLNQNQKVNKRALPKPEKKAAAIEDSNVPMNMLEEELHEMIAAIVNTTDFGITTMLGYVGLTSISAIKLAVQVNKRYGVTLDSKALVKSGTLQSIENEILSKMLNGQWTMDNGQLATQKKAEANDYQLSITHSPLSYAQTGVYFECISNPTSTVYNIPVLLSFPTNVEATRLADVIKQVVEAHPELSVHFITEGDTVMQTLADSVPVEVPITEMSDEELTTYKREFVRPFNLQEPPLYRFEVVKTESGIKLLMDVHHLVFDGGSADLFIRQICSVLDGVAVEKENYTYLDFVSDQQAAEDSDTFRAAKEFFAERLQTCEGASEISADLSSRPSEKGTNGETHQGFIGEAVCRADFDKATAFCRQQEITPAHLFLAATSYVVSRYTNSREVYLSTISSGRSNLKIADTMGMFVNTLALRLNIDDVTVGEYLKQVSESFDETLRHEDYPFARIASDYGFHPAISFAYQVGVLSDYTVGGQPIGQEPLELNVPKFKINIKIEPRGVVVQYDDSLYSARLGNALAESIVAVVNGIMAQPQVKVRQLSIVSKGQEEELSHLRQTATGETPFKVFHECISHFAQTKPEQEALVACDATYTYREMDEATNRIANGLRQRGVETGDRVALLLPRTSRLILSMFGVQKAGAAYIPCDPEYPADRVRLILEDSEARYIITTADRMDTVPADKAIDVEKLVSYTATEPQHSDQTPDDLAYLIYTSGSTGRPKGVMLRHEGMCNYATAHPANVEAYAVANSAKSILGVTTISFDASLHEIAIALFNGLTLVLANEEQAKNPLDMAALIREHHIGYVSATPSQWQTWIYSDEFVEAIRNVPIIRFGGERLPENLLHQMQQLTPSRILNTYGPTETTVSSNIQELTHAERVTVGRPQLNVKEFVVDSDGNELPVGVVGELYIGGKGVARGYNNLDEMTRERFIDYHGTRIYKSGDYAMWAPDGDVFILGRKDNQIKLRGLRIELGEIENVILQVEGIKQVVVTIRQIGGMEHLCAYFTADREIDIAQMKAEISNHLTDYMVPSAYLQLDAIPMTPNGKTDIKSLPEPVTQSEGTTSSVGTSRRLTLIEKELQGMVAEVLGVEDVDIESPLSMAGLTSLSAIRLAILVQKRFGVTIKVKQMVKNSTIMSIEDEIISEKVIVESEKDPSLSPLPSSLKSVPLSFAQTGVYFECLKNPTATQYNVPRKITFPRDTDTGALAEAIRTLVRKHPLMTAHFGQDDSGITQTVDPEQTVDIPISQMSEEQLTQYKFDFVRPFNLATGPLYRFEIVTTGQNIYLLFDVHHLIFDGGSTDIFFRQLCSLLDDIDIEDEALSYTAYVMEEKVAENSEEYLAAKAFFKSRLEVCEAATDIRPDLPKPFQGMVGNVTSTLDMDTIEAFCRDNNITPPHLIVSAVYYALSRFANSDQVCITTVSNGRSDLRIRNTVGMFVNTLVLNATIGTKTVREFLKETSENFDETLLHENYPFAQIAADYGLTAEIQFVYELGVVNNYSVGGTSLEMEALEINVPKFPITIFIAENDGQPSVCVAYDNGKYSARLMQSLADAVKVTVERMMAKPDTTLTSIGIVSDEEAKRIIQIGTGKEIDVDLSKTFANLFTEQAQRTPEAPAVVDKDSQLTYGEMDRYSNALAHQLIDFGVQPNDFVCVMLDRFKEFPLAVLSIHKAGAAYTPLDFEYPNERLSYMLENSESKVLITTHEVLAAKQAEGGMNIEHGRLKILFIDDFMAEVQSQLSTVNCQLPIDLSTPDGLAYMIYTSGSTGKPKGAMLHQAGLRNFIAVVIDMEKLTAADRISGHRSFSFDAHIEDMYPILTLGGSFHIMPTEIRKDLAAIRQFLFDHQITGGGYSTAMTCLLLNTFDDLPIRFTTGGGEKMDGVFSDHIEIINVYGPTECTDDTSYYSIAPGQRVENIPIGQSVANNWNFVVDTSGNLVPQGVAGELCFAGIQVGRGYWRLPERTAKSFVDCPFVKQDRWGRPVRMYHTGDLCRWNEDGQIEYMGRIDTQVKLRGFRIELGEIESKALNIEGIRQAAAEVRKVQGNEHLVLYYTLDESVTLSDEDIRSTLTASSLAEYMVPDAYMQMDAMPMTPNGKINRKVLPAPEMKRATEYEAPMGEMEQLFCSIFSDILKIKEVGATDNFFEIGGTSINAIKVIVEASKHGVQIVFNDLFNQKTPRALAAYVESSSTNLTSATSTTSETSPSSPQADSTAAEHYAPLNALLAANSLTSFRDGKHQAIGDVLLTGATGYLGIHILNELLTNYHGRIICPVRAKNNDEAAHRLKTLYFYYFGNTEEFLHITERVTAFAAEVTQPDALERAAAANFPFSHLLTCSLTVINCVANVKHFSAGNDIEMVNIESVRHLITFCLRTGSRLVHISTNSIAGMSVNGVPGPEACLTEQDFYIGQHVDYRKYIYSKFKAEELVLDAIAHHGLNAKIMRVGNLSARQKDGEFQINFNTNNFLALLRAFVVIGMVPYENLNQRFEFSPIDEVAHTIMLLAQTPKECVVFHPYNTHRQFLSDILDGFAEAGITLKRVETEEFQLAIERMMDNPDLVMLLRPLMAYNTNDSHKTRYIESTNDFTTQVLYRMGYQWPITATDYVHRFVDTIVGFDYFNV